MRIFPFKVYAAIYCVWSNLIFFIGQLSEKSNYDKVFDSLQPVNNMLGGDKVKPVRTPSLSL